MGKARIGIEVMRATDGEVLFAHNAEGSFNPASNTKMLTTAAALAFLGSDYRYLTVLAGPEPDTDGVVTGDVVLRGSGDPSLTTTDLAELAHDLSARGVVRIEGDLYADPRFHDPNSPAGAVGVGEGALVLHRNSYQVHVEAGELNHHGHVRVEPRSELFRVVNLTTTVKAKRSRLKIDAHREGDQVVVTVSGKVALGRGEYIDKRRLSDGTLAAAHVLSHALSDFGVTLTGNIKIGPLDVSHLLAVHRSVSLADVCRISNKPSNNFVAESIYRTLGAELHGVPGTLEKGTRAVVEYLTSMGVPRDAYRIVNGSGLTHENRISPHALAQLLRGIYYDPATAPDFLTSLAIAGIDGTIASRFQGTDAVGLVRAKTGTLNGVSALSGYVGDKDDVIVFSIFMEGFRQKRTPDARRLQVRLVQAMLRYLHADTATPATPSTGDGPSEMQGPAEDSESDGESLNLR